MATLYAYPLGTPKTNDLIIGTSVPLPQTTTTDEQTKTVNFTVASIVALITTATGAQSFQQVTNIDQTTIGLDLVSVTTNNVQITGILYDSANAKGTLGQVLTASALGKTVWATDTSGVTSVTTTDGTFIDLTPNTPATGAVTVTADLSATGTKDATTFLRGDNTWNVPTGAVASLTTTGTTGVSTLAAGVLNIPNYTYTETDTLQTVCTRASTTNTSITMTGTGASGYLYVTGNAATTAPTHTQGLAFAYNNSGGVRENEIFWNTGTTTTGTNDTAYLGFWNEFLNSAAGDARVSSLQLKLYGTGELELTGPVATSTIANTYWRMPKVVAPGTGYYLSKNASTIDLDWTEPSISIANHDGVPASASATGTAGTIRFDGTYIYVCTATDTWFRAAVATW